MDNQTLKNFWVDKDMRETVHSYLIEYLKAKAVEKVFNKEDVSAVAEAKEMIDSAFNNLDLTLDTQRPMIKTINESR